MNIQPQSGLGDLIFALPLIESVISRGQKITVATNHDYALRQYDETGLVECVPVEIVGTVPRLREGFTHLKYSRYKEHYFESYYFHAFHSRHDFEPAVDLARQRLSDYCRGKYIVGIPNGYCVYAPPRTANRHKKSKNFSCAPVDALANSRVDAANMATVTVGQNEVFTDAAKEQWHTGLNLIDELTFPELVCVIMNAERVISQVSAITALAGLLGVKTDFLPARTETPVLHAKHVAGVVWPGQEVVQW